MTTPRRLAVRRLVVPGAAGLLALGLTGCGAGLDAQTYQTRTVADATNANLGTLSVRNIAVLPPAGGRTYEAGTDARGTFVVANSGNEGDRLVEITSPAATEVVLTNGGRPTELEVPPRGSTQETGAFILRGLTGPLITGEVVTLVFRFERSGDLEVIVPVSTNGRAERPVFTGEPGSEEGEPALQGPAGGHSSEEEGEEGSPDAGEGEEGSAEGGGTEGGESGPVGPEASTGAAPEPSASSTD